MTDSERDTIRQKMKERMECGHTGEEHAAAALILLACESLHIPTDVMLAACAMIADGSHARPQTEKMPPMARMGHA